MQKLPATGPREARESVLVGDMVVRHLTKHWQPHGGRCLCGLAEETVQRVFWECPRYAVLRQVCEQGNGSRLPPRQGQLGAPAELPPLTVWRSVLRPSTWRRPQWRAKELFLDASGLQPKEAHVRMAGWAICGRSGGQ